MMSTATRPSVLPEDLKQLGLGTPAGEAGRKRAQKACLSCRSRKVRCDVSVVCQPCTNCQLHGKNCLVTGRGSRLAKAGRRRDRRNTDVTAAALEAGHVSQPTAAALQQTDGMTPARHGRNEENGDSILSENGWDSCDLEQGSGVPEDHLSFYALESSVACSEQQSESHSRDKAGRTASVSLVRPASLPSSMATVTYSYFRFLTLGNLHKIPSQDVNYLESQGCLHVPMPPILDDFIQHYFLHIHPLNPLINEGDFWDMYAQRDGSQGPRDTMSLLLFQAMLFSSCTYVPFTSIQRLGFNSLRAARGEFYRKVKLLYDMDTETSPLPLAQTALLLMSWVPPSNLTLIPYKMWLARAVQHTKSLNANRVAKETSPTATKRQKALRRLWWCCVSWDRVSPLCTRYTPYIRHDTFDFDNSSVPTSKDLEDEVFRSCVYNPSSKQRLLSLFEVYMEFIIILTGVLSLTFPFDGSLGASGPSEQQNDDKVAECSRAMKSWLARAMAVIPPSIGLTTDANKKPNLHKSVSVHVNLMYIYYNHSSIALSHTKLLRLVKSNINKDLEACELRLIQKDLQEAVQSMIQILENLNTHRLVRWLPISVLVCMVFPLAFTVVTARLSAAADPNLAVDESDSVKSYQKDLSILTETMRSFLPQYDGVDLIKETVKHAADLAHTAGKALSKDSATPTTSWAQILVRDPKLYLRMVMSIDLSINKGRLAEEEDFPTGLFNKMGPDATPNHPYLSHQARGSDDLPESMNQEMIPDLTSFWDVGPSMIDVQCTDAPSSAGEPRKASMDRLDVDITETAWEGSSSLCSTGAESLWEYGNAYTADQFADTIETWAGIPLTDLELGYPS